MRLSCIFRNILTKNMQSANLSGENNFGNKRITINTQVLIFEEEGIFFLCAIS